MKLQLLVISLCRKAKQERCWPVGCQWHWQHNFYINCFVWSDFGSWDWECELSGCSDWKMPWVPWQEVNSYLSVISLCSHFLFHYLLYSSKFAWNSWSGRFFFLYWLHGCKLYVVYWLCLFTKEHIIAASNINYLNHKKSEGN